MTTLSRSRNVSPNCGTRQARLPHRPLCFRSPFSPTVRSAVGAHGVVSSSPGRSWKQWDCRWRSSSGGRETPNTAKCDSRKQAFHVGHGQCRGASRRRPPRSGHPDVEILLQVPQHVVLPPLRHAQGGPLSEENHEPGIEGDSASEKRSNRMYQSDVPRSVQQDTRAPRDSLSGELSARARSSSPSPAPHGVH